MMKIRVKSIRSVNTFNKWHAGIFTAVFAAVGAIVLLATHASGFSASLEAENSTKSGSTTSVGDASASGGSALKFASAGSSSCPLPAYPDANCTGVPAGTTLTNYTGPMSITSGATIDSKIINGCIDINTPNLTIKNSKIIANQQCNDVVGNYDGVSTGTLTIQDTEIDCKLFGGTALGDHNINAYRLNIHGCENGGDFNENITIQDSYIHDMFNSSEAHTDGIQMSGHLVSPPNNFALGSLNVSIVHNTIFGMGADGSFGTSAIISNGVQNADKNILIQDNLLAGGAYTLYCVQNGPGINERIINNHFTTRFGPHVGAFAPATDCNDESVVTGNVYQETGQPIPLN